MRLRKRGGVWHVRYWEQGARVERSTKCTDRRAAEKIAAQWERDAADPHHARTRDATLNDAFALLLAHRREAAEAHPPRASLRTVKFYAEKAGHWVRILGDGFRLVDLTSAVVRKFISQRRSEWANDGRTKRISDHTIAKELVALRASLKVAKVEGLWKGDVTEILPVGFSPGYMPKSRWLPPDEIQRLLTALEPDQAARVAFIVATSAEWGATVRAERADVSETPEGTFVLLRGTKRSTRWRTVPIVTQEQKGLLAYALKHAAGTDGKLFLPWNSYLHSIWWACKRAGIERCSPNDLRRSFTQWMRQAGVSAELVAPMMGHTDTVMVQRVYGRLDAVSLGRRVRSDLCPTGAPPESEKDAEFADSADQSSTTSPQETQGEVSAPGPTRTGDIRIRSPERLWPEPGKNTGRSRSAKSLAPQVPHLAVTQPKGGRRD